jgi:hypothetical protein
MKNYLKKFGSIFLIICGLANAAKADTYDWIGAVSTDVTDIRNWARLGGIAGIGLGLCPGPPGATDDVRIGVASTYTPTVLSLGVCVNLGNQTITLTRFPIVTGNTTWKSITFGNNGVTAATYYLRNTSGAQQSFGMKYTMTLTVNGVSTTLTVTGNIAQNHYAGVADPRNIFNAIIAGTGNVLCQGNVVVGDATTQPATSVADVALFSAQVNQLTINGNILLNCNGFNNTSAGEVCYPCFSVEKGTTILLGQMNLVKSFTPTIAGFAGLNPGVLGFKGYGQVIADNTGYTATAVGSPNTFELRNKTPIITPLIDQFYVYFTFGGNSGTTLFSDNNAENQTVYTANEPSTTVTATYINTTSPAYYNLTFSGASTKVVDKNSTIGTATPQGLSVGNNWTTGGGIVNLNTNNPTVTVTGSWTNSTTVNQDAGPITITGSVINNASGVLNLGASPTGNLSIGGNYTNNSGGIYTQGTGTTFFNGTGAQTLLDNSTAGTVFNKVTFNGINAASVSTMSAGTGNFAVASTGVLTMTSPAKLVAGTLSAAYLTLKSDVSGSASVAAITGSSTITGNVNVQRYAVGGAGRRNYRLLSSPVNQSLITTGVPGYGFTGLQATTMISGYGAVGVYNGSATPTANSFDLTPLGNPSVFFYYEPDADPNQRLISKSDYKGLNTINEKFPIGNGFLFFFRGDRTINGANGALKTSITSTPQNTTMNFLGSLNQGAINVNIPTNPTSTVNGNVVYSTPSTAVSTTFSSTPHTPNTNDGLHLVGNPYACAIDLEGVTLANSSVNIYMLNNAGTFGVYQKGSNSGSLNNGVGRFVLSGQGFFIQANPSGAASLSFAEGCKTTSPASVPVTFAIAKPRMFAVSKAQSDAVQSADAVEPTPHIMNIALTLDSVNNNETVIQFGEQTAKNSFDRQEDAYYMSGPAQTTFLASYTKDNQPCLINHMGGLDSIKTIPLYVEGQTDGIYTLKFAGASAIDQRYKLYLLDNFKKDSLDLSANDTYNFNIQRADKQTFGATRFALVRHDSGLHYNLLAFNGAKQNNAVALNWKTEFEGDYTNFVLQRSTDEGKTYNNMDSLRATGAGTYTYIDTKPVVGTNQYRLIQKSGSDPSKFSKIVAVDFLLPGLSKFKLYPNPATNIIKIDIGAPNDNAPVLNIKIYNINGLIVRNTETTANQTLSQDVSQLDRGTYILKVTGSNNKIYGTKTFIKL